MSRHERGLLAAAVGLHLVDALVTARAWELETNPLVQALGLAPWLALKVALVAGLIVAWRRAREHRLAWVGPAGAGLVGVLALANLWRLGAGPTGRLGLIGVGAVAIVAAGVAWRDRLPGPRRFVDGERVLAVLTVGCLLVSSVAVVPAGQSPVEGAAAAPGDAVWTTSNSQTGAAEYAGPSLGDDLVYGPGKGITALHRSNGSVKWTVGGGVTEYSSPAFDGSGNLLTANESGYVYSVDARTGEYNWARQVGQDISASPTVVDGTAYVAGTFGDLWALDASDGSTEWRQYVAKTRAAPTVKDGNVYVADYNSRLHKFDAETGTEDWNISLGGSAGFGATTVANGKVYVGTWGSNEFYAIDVATGSTEWKYTAGSDIRSTPTYEDGVVYFGSRDSKVYAYYENGTEKWSHSTNGNVDSSPTIAAGTVYVASAGDRFYALDATDGSEKWSTAAGTSGSPVVDDGTVYLVDGSGTVYAYETDHSKSSSGSRIKLGTRNQIDGISLAGGSAQTFTLSGTVTDTNGDPIQGATVSTNTSANTTTDAQGQYTLSLSNGTYALNATAPAYRATNTTVTVAGNTTKDLTLDPEQYEISGDVVWTNNTGVDAADVELYSPSAKLDDTTASTTGDYVVRYDQTGTLYVTATTKRSTNTTELQINQKQNLSGVTVTLPTNPTDQDPGDTDGDGTTDTADPDDDGDGLPDDLDEDDDGDNVPDDREVLIRGYVTNASNFGVPSAVATVENTDTNDVSSEPVNASGGFSLYTAEGNLSITANANGFAKNTTTLTNVTDDRVVGLTIREKATLAPQLFPSTARPRDDVARLQQDLSIYVDDSEFDDGVGESVNVSFYLVDGGYVGSDTLTTDRRAEIEDVRFQPDDVNAWYVVAEDVAGRTTTSQQFRVITPAEIVLKNESDPTQNLTALTNASVTYYGASSAETRQITDETLNLSNVPDGEPTVAVFEADGYYSRSLAMYNLSIQRTAYLLPESADATTVTFQLESYNADFEAQNTSLIIKRPLTLNGSVSYRTVTSDEFGATGEFEANLQQGARYRLLVRNDDGDQITVGPYTARQAGLKVIRLGPSGEVAINTTRVDVAIAPQTQRLRTTAYNISTTVGAQGEADLQNTILAVELVNGSDRTQLGTAQFAGEGTRTVRVNLSDAGGEKLVVTVDYLTTAGQTGQARRVYRIARSFENSATLLNVARKSTRNFPTGQGASAFQSILALFGTVVATGGVAATTRASTEALGLTAVGALAGFALIGFVAPSLVVVTGLALVGLSALRRGL